MELKGFLLLRTVGYFMHTRILHLSFPMYTFKFFLALHVYLRLTMKLDIVLLQ